MTDVEALSPAPGNADAVLSKATIRAAQYLGLTNRALAQIIGLSESQVSRMKAGAVTLEPGSKPFELAQCFVRLFRSLDAMTGGDDAASRSWLQTRNLVLGAKPIELMPSIQGLLAVLSYVDSRRAPL